MSTATFKYFCLNMDGLSFRDSEYPDDVQAILKGKIIRQIADPTGEGLNDGVATGLYVCIETKPLIDFVAKSLLKGGTSNQVTIEAYPRVIDMLENDEWDPKDIYAVLAAREVN